MRLEKGTRVRYSDAWLSRCQPDLLRRFQGRTGVVEGYRLGASEPIVRFPKDGRRKEQRLFEVPVGDLAIVLESKSV